MLKFAVKKIINFYKNQKNKKKVNLIRKLMGNESIRLLDIGAAGGIEKFQDDWQPFINKIEFIMCEPHQAAFNILKNSNHKIINKALSNERKSENLFFETQKAECSSMKELNIDYLKKFPKPERFKVIKKNIVETTTIDHEFKLNNFPHFIKIDTEGSELDILKGGEKTLDNVLGLVVETSFSEFHKNQVKFEEIKNYLEKKNIEFIDFLRLVKWERHNHRHHGQIQVADALFLRTPDEILARYKSKKMDISVLKNYLMILVVYNRADYIYIMLNNLDKTEKDSLYLKESYMIAEKSVKRIHLIERVFKFLIKNLV